jgi:hypothetical protein
LSPRYRYARAPRTRRVAGVPNKGEAAYGVHLEAQKRAGMITDYWFEGLTVKLANDTRFTPDYFVINADLEVELHEVKPASKGKFFAREDARLKLKVCASHFPFRVFVCWPAPGYAHWHREEVAA